MKRAAFAAGILATVVAPSFATGREPPRIVVNEQIGSWHVYVTEEHWGDGRQYGLIDYRPGIGSKFRISLGCTGYRSDQPGDWNLNFSVERKPSEKAKGPTSSMASTVSAYFDDRAPFTIEGVGNAGRWFTYEIRRSDDPAVVRDWVLGALKAKTSLSFRLLPSTDEKTADVDGLGPALQRLMEYCPLY